MAVVKIPDELNQQLEIIAQREGRSVEEIAASLLWQFRMAHWLQPEDTYSEEPEVENNDLFTLVMKSADKLGSLG
jgi:hypothetical protein